MQIYLNRPYRKKQEIFPYCLVIELKSERNLTEEEMEKETREEMI